MPKIIDEVYDSIRKIAQKTKPIYPCNSVVELKVVEWIRHERWRELEEWYPDGVPVIDGTPIIYMDNQMFQETLAKIDRMIYDRRSNDESSAALEGWRDLIYYEISRRNWKGDLE